MKFVPKVKRENESKWETERSSSKDGSKATRFKDRSVQSSAFLDIVKGN